MDMTTIARLGGNAAALTVDTVARAQRGQSGLRRSFTNGHGCRVCPVRTIPADLPEQERTRRADVLYRDHFVRLGRR